jgi:uncharacterized protein YsxB (DUF464 family)
MTTVAFFRASDQGLIGFEASGHTGFAEAGEDIVCAAVSALTEATLNGLRSVVKAPLMFDRNEKNALLAACLTPECTRETLEKAQILLQTLLEAVQAIAGEYPRNVRIIFKERRKYACSE